MLLEIKYGKRFEFRTIKTTLARMGWYNKMGYKPILPKNIDKTSSEKEIKEQIAKKFDEDKFKTIAQNMNRKFSKISAKLSETLNLYFKNVPKLIKVYLTNYGMGGSYDTPNKIIINVKHSPSIKVIYHEMMHLCIDDDIEKYKIEQWEKEKIVDLILNSKEFGFLKYNIWQPDYQGVEKYVDPLFYKYFFKDQNKFYSEIKKARS